MSFLITEIELEYEFERTRDHSRKCGKLTVLEHFQHRLERVFEPIPLDSSSTAGAVRGGGPGAPATSTQVGFQTGAWAAGGSQSQQVDGDDLA
ncbi:unnamed protein product, partial [Amoebophrya sp. A120]|eukprot:GSA120T00016425001.1